MKLQWYFWLISQRGEITRDKALWNINCHIEDKISCRRFCKLKYGVSLHTTTRRCFVTEGLLWHDVCSQGAPTHKTMMSHACKWRCTCPLWALLPQVQPSKNVVTEMHGKGKPPFYKNMGFPRTCHGRKTTLNLFIYLFFKSTPLWVQVWWKTRMVLEKWPDT